MFAYLLYLLVPVVCGGIVVGLYSNDLYQLSPQHPAIQLLPFLLLGSFLLASLRFNRSRYFFSAAAIAFIYFIASINNAHPNVPEHAVRLQLAALFIPLGLTILSELKERGIFTLWGSTRFVIIFLPFITGLFLFHYKPALSSEWLATSPIPVEIAILSSYPQAAWLTVLLCLLIMNGRLFAEPSFTRATLLGGFIGSLAIVHFHSDTLLPELILNAILLLFWIGLIQDSWRMAYIDPLTNLPGRRALNEALLKLSGNYSIAMADIDHFKKFNDRYGHDAGDEVLRMVAAKMKHIDHGGKAYRYGGEEFAIVFNGSEKNQASEAMEAIRQTIESSPFTPRRKDQRRTQRKKKIRNRRNVKITISGGIAQRTAELGTPEDVIRSADKALYRAKKRGRNCVVS